MKDKVKKQKAISSSILQYVEKYPGSLDVTAVTDLTKIDGDLAEADARRMRMLQSFVDSRSVLDHAADDLRCAIVQSRKAMEFHAVGARLPSLAPKSTGGMWLTSRINNVAVAHLKALEEITGDALVDKANERLTAAHAAFDGALSAARAQKAAWRNFNNGLTRDISIYTGKLVGYKHLAMYNVPPTERRSLSNEIRAVIATRKGGRKTATEEGTGAQVTTLTATNSDSTIPALPSVPTTIVPPSSEHPIVRANA